MAYPESCFQNIIGIRGICDPQTTTYYLDDIPGMDMDRLAQLADAGSPTGESLGKKLIESASRIMAADVEAIYDANYKVQNSLVSGCSSCYFTGSHAQGAGIGILIKDNTTSSFSRLVIDKLTAKVNSTGVFQMVIDDGNPDNTRIIENTYLPGVEYEFKNLNYSTKSKTVKVYFQEDNIQLAQLACPRSSSGCGCSGVSAAASDLQYTGLVNGVESQQAYGFQPCAFIQCDAADLLCFVAHSAPRMIGMGLLYKVAELYFQTKLQTQRNNKAAGTNTEDTKEEAVRYGKLYTSKLNGTGTRGIKDVVYTTLQQTSDVCIVCNSLLATAWSST